MTSSKNGRISSNSRTSFSLCWGPASFKKAIEQAEKLSDSLKLRYEEAEEDNKMKGEPKGLKNETSKATVPPGGVTPEALFGIMREQSVRIVVMDARSRRDFQESQIQVPSQRCISIPAEIISPGITVNQIEAQLPEESKEQWKRRGSADYIVLLDWFSSVKDLRLGTCLQSLKDALYKWDSKTVLRAEPLVLEGGYESWLLYYPMYTSNAKTKPPREQSSHPIPTLNFSYPSLEEPRPESPALPEPKPPAEVNGSTAEEERSRPGSEGPREQPQACVASPAPSPVPTNKPSKVAAGQHASTAGPVPQIDRSKKPSVAVTEDAQPNSERASSGREGKLVPNGPAVSDRTGKPQSPPGEGETPAADGGSKEREEACAGRGGQHLPGLCAQKHCQRYEA
ncbi:hypothetical protein SKAU_G00309220 [Synaphobranchus kaupii]|uniref:Rhodanese domain-containing protein n=1 Tax=Synaphobranchus kaupii TaxID=118154 RepID=A0A9Q1ERI4_SYNKA|nr:hypothetical protein SKAU_G00309220 [Synaphobranchus kaupii]